MSSSEQSPTIYELVGGRETFDRIAENFYNRVAQDKALYAMYPPDLAESKRTLALFLTQYFGGPGDYSVERGHPRLRMRHAPYSIGTAERDAWLSHMNATIRAEAFAPEIEAVFLEYFDRAANFMMNRAN
ncbi:MAG TPA: globin [Abditibacteriaceae bacterium]|jgi:hemoglobin